MNRKNAKGGALTFANLANAEVPASQLKGMTNKKDVLFLEIIFVAVPLFNLINPIKLGIVPRRALAIERAAGASRRNEYIVRHVRQL